MNCGKFAIEQIRDHEEQADEGEITVLEIPAYKKLATFSNASLKATINRKRREERASNRDQYKVNDVSDNYLSSDEEGNERKRKFRQPLPKGYKEATRATNTLLVRHFFESTFDKEIQSAKSRTDMCGKCKPCLSSVDCGNCTQCLKMVKFGGEIDEKQMVSYFL